MTISRRGALLGATAAAVVAGVPGAVLADADPAEAQFLTVFRQLPDRERALIHIVARHFAGLPIPPELDRRARPQEDGEAQS